MIAIALGRPAPAPIAARDWLASVAAHGVLLAALAWWAASVDDPPLPAAAVPIRWVEAVAEAPAPSVEAVRAPALPEAAPSKAPSANPPIADTPPAAAAPVAEPSRSARSTRRAPSPHARSDRSGHEPARPAARAPVAAAAAPMPATAAAIPPAPVGAADPTGPSTTAGDAPASLVPVEPTTHASAAAASTTAAIPRASSSTAQPSRWRSDFEALLLAQKRYPRQARRLGQQGVVTIHAQFAADGELLGCEVAASSGFRALDDAAVELVRMAAAQLRASSVPGSRAELRIPIAYELNGHGT